MKAGSFRTHWFSRGNSSAVGIRAEAAPEEVFTPFYTTKAGGTATGLGLTTVRNIVERHRGRVWFETTKGQGATFIVELPSRPSFDSQHSAIIDVSLEHSTTKNHRT